MKLRNVARRICLLWLTVVAALGCQSVVSSKLSPPPPEPIVFFDWVDDVPMSMFDRFTAETGIPVRYEAYESQEEALDRIRAGERVDVLVLENRLVPVAAGEGLIVELDLGHIPNFVNISPSFRDLIYDPGNRFSIPFNWGTTGLVFRRDLVYEPVTRWADLWDLRYAGRVAVWRGQPREVIGIALKTLGYSVNSEDPEQLKAALDKLLELRPHVRFMEDIDPETSARALANGEIWIAHGWAGDVLEGRALNPNIDYALPQEGAFLWGDNFTISRTTRDIRQAETLIDFLLRPEIAAEIANANHYATANLAALPLIDPEIRFDPVVFPGPQSLGGAEIVLPLSPEGQALYDDIWERFLSAGP